MIYGFVGFMTPVIENAQLSQINHSESGYSVKVDVRLQVKFVILISHIQNHLTVEKIPK